MDIAKAWHKLSPNSSYIYSVSATNSNWAYEGSAYGANKVFKTLPASPPSIEGESVSHITQTDATLEAQINTEGLETSYEFHLLSAPACLEANPPCEPPQYIFPLPGGKLLGSFVGQSVSVDLNSEGVSLSKGSRYEYWLTATSAAGTTEGLHQAFTKPSDPPLPNTQTSGTGGQLPAIQSPRSASPSHHQRHRRHRRHRRGLHRSKLDGARYAG